jgi:2-iminobutanoate/2-iminopropanoate deaminase
MAVTRGNPSGVEHHRASVYNHFVRVDNPTTLIFVSGQVSRDEHDRSYAIGDMREQTRQCIKNIERVLAEAGATLADIVSTTVYTTDIREFREIVAAREEFFVRDLPTSTMVEVTHLADPGLLVEIAGLSGCIAAQLRLQTSKDLLGCDRQVRDPDAGRVVDRVPDRSHDRRKGRFAQSVDLTIRIRREVDGHVGWKVPDAGEHVVAKVAVLQLAPVETHLLEQRLTNSKCDVALDLELGLDRVDDSSGVRPCVIVGQRDTTGLEVDANLGGSDSLVPVDGGDALASLGIEAALSHERSASDDTSHAASPNDCRVGDIPPGRAPDSD